jgi:hypothetical protein
MAYSYLQPSCKPTSAAPKLLLAVRVKAKRLSSFAKAALGTALHEALAQIYQDWHYKDALASLS